MSSASATFLESTEWLKSNKQSEWQENQNAGADDKKDTDDRNSRILLYGYSSDDECSEIDHQSISSSPVSPKKVLRSTATNSSSDLKSSTPGVTISTPRHKKTGNSTTPQVLHNKPRSNMAEVQAEGPPSPLPALHSSLSAPADFVYDRYSAEVRLLTEDLPPLANAYEEIDSPIEVATPVSYLQPKSRPSMISVFHMPAKPSLRPTIVQVDSPSQSRSSLTSRSTRRSSIVSTRSGYPACEATPFEVPALPENALTMISNASRESLITTRNSGKDSKLPKKASMPLLSRALKFTHSRIGSRASSANQVPQVKQLEATKQEPRPSTGIAKSTTSNWNTRSPLVQLSSKPIAALPQDDDSSDTTQSSPHITALPSVPDNLPPPMPDPQSFPHRRQKSFSNLRSRSTSLSQAFKSRISVRVDDTPVPPVPVLVKPEMKASIDLGHFPTPPITLKTSPMPRNSFASVSRPARR